MQICKKTGIKKFFTGICFVSIVNCFLFSNSMEMPKMPSMPSMPSISLDSSFGGNFYKPSMPSIDMMGNNFNNKKDSDFPENKAGNTANNVISNNVINDNMLLGNIPGNITSPLLKDNSTLTANDISSLYGAGLFSSLASLDSSFSGMAGAEYLNNSKTNALLQNVLNELNELKDAQSKATLEEKKNFSDNQKDSVNFRKETPSVLRFKVNDYNIKDSLVEVFLSEPEDNGTFLFTADRNYIANNKSRSETFYFLFKNEKVAGMSAGYKVSASVVQDYENKNSFIYKLCQIDNLTAEKIGNLVVMKYDDKDLKVDLLIDLDQK